MARMGFQALISKSPLQLPWKRASNWHKRKGLAKYLMSWVLIIYMQENLVIGATTQSDFVCALPSQLQQLRPPMGNACSSAMLAQSTPTYLALDGVERLIALDAARAGGSLLHTLFRLQNLCTGANVGVITIGNTSLPQMRNFALGVHPACVHVPAYTKDHLLCILSSLRDGSCKDHLYSALERHVCDTFGDMTRDLRSLRYIIHILLPIFLQPVRSGPLDGKSALALVHRIKPACSMLRQRLFHQDLTRDDLSAALAAEEKGGTGENAAAPHRSTDAMELPALTKFLLLAAFLASHNHSTSDIKIFTSRNVGRRKKRRARKVQVRRSLQRS